MVRVDTSRSYQAITGFGVSVPATAESVYGPEFYDALLNDLGCAVVYSEADSSIASDMKDLKSDLVITDSGDPLNVFSNIDKKSTWGSLMSLRVSNPGAHLGDIYDFVYSGLSVTGKRVVESGLDDPVWKVLYEDKSEITVRSPAYFTKIPSAAIDLARRIHSALTQGFAGYVSGPATTVSDMDDPAKTICKMGEKEAKFQTAKHFYKYVRPGMIRVEATSDDLLVSAFKSDKMVVVLINDTNEIIDTQVDFGDSVGHYTSYTSVENDFHYEESDSIVGGKLDMVVIPNSITTFIVN